VSAPFGTLSGRATAPVSVPPAALLLKRYTWEMGVIATALNTSSSSSAEDSVNKSVVKSTNGFTIDHITDRVPFSTVVLTGRGRDRVLYERSLIRLMALLVVEDERVGAAGERM
jgi:predicted Zn-dependent protease